MPGSGEGDEQTASRSGVFATTHWSVVLAAGDPSSPAARSALETLCRTYWYPLYAYVRRQGHGPEDAQDLTQEFFARLLAADYLARVDRHKGKFRSFLLVGLNYMLADEHDKVSRLKRGGGQPVLSLDAQSAEARYQLEPVDQDNPERAFERRWAMALIEQVLTRLEQEYAQASKTVVFAALKDFLTGAKESQDYPAAARQLQMTEGAVRVAVHRLRQRFGKLFREEVTVTVADPKELEDEMRHLLAVLSG
jgi:RNA polymerase sigma-70 factor (ECF subfamily)